LLKEKKADGTQSLLTAKARNQEKAKSLQRGKFMLTIKKIPRKAKFMDASNISVEARINPNALPIPGKVDLARINALSTRLGELVERIKTQAFLPAGGKVPPVFNQTQLAALCKMSPDSMARRLAKASELGLPAGSTVAVSSAADGDSDGSTTPETSKDEVKEAPKGRKHWTLAEARQWIKACAIPFVRPKGVPGAVITIANFKGGVGKTVTSMTLAQGLALMGYKVLAIDVDPQGSLTSLFGILPTEVSDDMTILPLMIPPVDPKNKQPQSDETDNSAPRSTIKQSIQKTYWDGLDLVAGSRSLFSGEFYLPSRQISQEPGFDFYQVLNRALDDGTRMEYDFIIIDTMPALSYLTMNTLWAADAVLMPLPPEGLDIASSSQFWTMFTELAEVMTQEKTFHYIGVLPSKVDHTKGHTKSLLQWIKAGYEDFVLPVEIPVTQVVSLGATEMRTVFDITKYVGASKTYARAREAYDKLVEEIDHLTRRTCWKGE
jgi:chromosome partitioning protein